MKSFFASLLYASLIGGIGAALSGKAYRRHLQYLTALLCTAVIAAPLLGLIPRFDLKIPQEDPVSVDSSAAESLVIQQSRQDAETALGGYIFSETGIKVLSVSIDIESGEEGLIISCIRVKTKTESERRTVSVLLSSLYGEDTTVEVINAGVSDERKD